MTSDPHILTPATSALDPTVLKALLDESVRGALGQVLSATGVEPMTVAQVAAEALELMTSGTQRAHGSYIKVLVNGWTHPDDPSRTWAGLGDRFAHEVRAKDLKKLLGAIDARAAHRAARTREQRLNAGLTEHGAGGTTAQTNAVSAWRAVFKYAAANHHILPDRDPSQLVDKAPRGNSTRRHLKAPYVDSLLLVARCTGNDPALDELMCWFFFITGARRSGLLALRLGDINPEACTVALDEKHDIPDIQPVPDWLIIVLLDFAHSRGASQPDDKVFRTNATRTKPSQPITSRRLDSLFGRIQKHLSWADQQQVTAHTLRHHAIAVVGMASRVQVAEAFARHAPSADTHLRYGIATPEEVAAVVISLHGGSHPWVEN